MQSAVEQGDSTSTECLSYTHVIKTVSELVNELDLAFDSIAKEDVEVMKSTLRDIAKDKSKRREFINETHKALEAHEQSLLGVTMSTQKVRSNQLEFLNEIELFGGKLKCSVFAAENKNTKKTLVKYLYNIFLSCVLSKNIAMGMSQDSLSSIIAALTTTPPPQAVEKPPAAKAVPSKSKKEVPLDPLGGLVQNLMGDGNIMKIAQDLSAKLQEQNKDPMSLLTSLMSGNVEDNNDLKNLMASVTTSIDEKVRSGEIDAKALERSAAELMANPALMALSPMQKK